MQKWQASLGFTLLELIVTISLIGVLTALAYPSYQHYLLRGYRNDGKTALLDLGNRMEEYYLKNNSYQGATLANVGESGNSTQGYYQLVIASTTPTYYLLYAVPAQTNVKQDECGTLSYDSLGIKGSLDKDNAGSCWNG